MRPLIAAVAAALVLGACSGDTTEDAPDSAPAPPAGPTTASAAPATPAATAAPSAEATAEPEFEAAAAMRTVRALAGEIGPRESTTAAYREAADLVGEQLGELGFEVSEQAFRAPAGVSWGVPVPAGRTVNVIATPPGLGPDSEHVLVGAHLDTVPQAPGAEDNASGVAVLLEAARLAAEAPESLRLPVVFVAFGAEEPRAPGDEGHHYGSRHYVDEMTDSQRDSLTGMISLDRVGVGRVMPVCNGGMGTRRVVEQLLDDARSIDVPANACENRASDHWSFEKAGFAVARLGSTPYAAYHSAQDRLDVIRQSQLERAGRLAWAWLTRPPSSAP